MQNQIPQSPSKILIAIPQHDKKRYCLDKLFDWLRDASLENCEVLIRYHKGEYGEKDGVKKQREFFRKFALEKDFTHLLFIGADTIPPLDVLPRFLAHNTDVVGGIYYGRRLASNGNPYTAVAWKHRTDGFNTRENLEKLSGLVEVDGMGMDCVLFTRKALESFSYLDWVVNDDDYPAYDILKEKGFTVYLDTDLVCKHYNSEDSYS